MGSESLRLNPDVLCWTAADRTVCCAVYEYWRRRAFHGRVRGSRRNRGPSLERAASYNRTAGKRRGRETASSPMSPGSFTRSIRSLVTKTKRSVIPLPRFLSTMPAAKPSSNQNGVEKGGPIRFSSRLKEGRALVPDVWSIYKFVLTRTPL